jgi:hypothetical protein
MSYLNARRAVERIVFRSILNFAGPGAMWKMEVPSKVDETVCLASHSFKYNRGLDPRYYTESDMGVISQPSLCFLRVPASKYPGVARCQPVGSFHSRCPRLSRMQNQLLTQLWEEQ